ncbi:MAG: PadR family transcriptional regulator [Acidobacteriota bacterium]|nr:PadR family transcriptional regulator [Acidobacteriota bacterium]
MPPPVDGFLPLTHLVYAVLLSLAEKPDHPYELVRRIRERSDGRIDPGTGSFYTVLAQAERQGLIRECRAQAETRRRVYEIAPLGRRVLTAEAGRLAQQLKATQAALVPDKKRA